MKNFLYSKATEANKELAPLQIDAPLEEAPSSLSTQVPTPPNGYEPNISEEREPDLFFVISGGEKRERDYLNRLKTQSYRSLSIIFVATRGKKSGGNPTQRSGTSPNDILILWNKIYKENEKTLTINNNCYKLEEIDQIFFLTDLDHFHAQLKNILNNNQAQPYQWIISNPCFEMWLYYSYISDDPSLKLQQLNTLSDIKRPKALKKHLDTLTKGSCDSRKAFDNMEVAIQNANQYWKGLDAHKIPNLFSTQMKDLAEKIWARIKNESLAKRNHSFKKELRSPQNCNLRCAFLFLTLVQVVIKRLFTVFYRIRMMR